MGNTLKIINTYLTNSFKPDACVHGFVPGRSIKSNAQSHLARNIVLSIDIKNFFDSISAGQVKRALIKHSFNDQVADWLATITTFENHLVQGFHSSPTLANMVFNDVDKLILKACGKDVTYTRYADDLYFSSDSKLPEIDELKKILIDNGFEVNDGKTSIMKRGGRQYVTGLTVFDSSIPRISRNTKRALRLEIYYVNKYGYRNHAIKRLSKKGPISKKDKLKIQTEIYEIRHRLNGWIDFIHSIEPVRAKQLNNKLITAKR